MFGPLLAEGVIVNFHSCGCVQEVAADLAEIGVTVLNPVQSSANDLERVKADTVGRMALAGAISSGLLQQGTPEEVREEVARVMAIMKPGGGYVCGPDQWLPDFPEENLRAMRETARELGEY
jgi:uroporphyrinogen decarboxylase